MTVIDDNVAIENVDDATNIRSLLILYGYKPDKQDVIAAAKNGIPVPDIERFGIIADKEVWEACLISSEPKKFKYHFVGIDMKKEIPRMKLYDICKKAGAEVSLMRHLEKHKDLKIDKIAMGFLCTNRRNGKLICKHMTQDNIIPEHLESYIKTDGSYCAVKLTEHIIANY